MSEWTHRWQTSIRSYQMSESPASVDIGLALKDGPEENKSLHIYDGVKKWTELGGFHQRQEGQLDFEFLIPLV